MRHARIVLSALLLAGSLTVAAAARQTAPALTQPALNAAIAVGAGVHGAVGVDFFYSNLAPYGYWVNRPSNGWAWVPRNIHHGWRPYSAGRWVYTDYGWTWDSSEPFGWATYHYGRWNLDPDYGWEWTPGTDWGPAWVSWQQGNGYLGWAPLPPNVGWSAGVGLDLGGFNLSAGIDPGWYCFVPERSFLAVNVGGFAVPPFRNATIFRNTTNITSFRDVGGRVFNGSVAVDHVAQVTGHPVRQLTLAAASRPGLGRVSGNSLAMFRPASVVRRANAPDPARIAPRSVASGRVAQQLVSQRRSEAAQFRLAGNGANGANVGNSAKASRAAQAAQAARPPESRGVRTAQAAPHGRTQGSAVTGNRAHDANVAHRTSTTRTPQSANRPSSAQARHQATPAARTKRPAPSANRNHRPPERSAISHGSRTSAAASNSMTSATTARRAPQARNQRPPAQRSAISHGSRTSATTSRPPTSPTSATSASAATEARRAPRAQQPVRTPSASASPARSASSQQHAAPSPRPSPQAHAQRQSPPPQQRQARAPAPPREERRQPGGPPPGNR